MNLISASDPTYLAYLRTLDEHPGELVVFAARWGWGILTVIDNWLCAVFFPNSWIERARARAYIEDTHGTQVNRRE